MIEGSQATAKGIVEFCQQSRHPPLRPGEEPAGATEGDSRAGGKAARPSCAFKRGKAPNARAYRSEKLYWNWAKSRSLPLKTPPSNPNLLVPCTSTNSSFM